MADRYYLNYDDGNLRVRMARWGEFKPELRRVVQRLAIGLQGAVKEDKLTGQVLHVRTGTLRRSINEHVVEEGNGVTGIVGTNVIYAHPHEFGFHGIVNVRAYARRSSAQMQVKARSRVSRSGGEVMVRAHQRHMDLPERSFLRSTLKEWTPKIVDDIQHVARGM